MKFLLKVELPVETANAAVKNGTLSKTMQSILEEQTPESVYFLAENGKRTGHIVLNMDDAAQIPEYCEPWFLAFNANIEIHPVMKPEDLARAEPSFEHAVMKYGANS